jgi:hypothetical protein
MHKETTFPGSRGHLQGDTPIAGDPDFHVILRHSLERVSRGAQGHCLPALRRKAFVLFTRQVFEC